MAISGKTRAVVVQTATVVYRICALQVRRTSVAENNYKQKRKRYLHHSRLSLGAGDDFNVLSPHDEQT